LAIFEYEFLVLAEHSGAHMPCLRLGGKMSKIMENFINARQALYDHVDFVPDLVSYAIDDRTNCYWFISRGEVRCATSRHLLELHKGKNSCADEIYTQRFYKKHIYEGEELTLVFCDSHVDDCRWFRIFKNCNRLRELENNA
jgi:hypothetical protein